MRRVFAFLLLAAAASSALAEVSDKMPSIGGLWLQGLLVGLVLFLISRLRLWLAFAVMPVTLFFAISGYGLVNDPFVGPAIRSEQGFPYVAAAYGSAVLCVLGNAFGLLVARRKGQAHAHHT